jgi:DNA polymerase I
VKKLFLVDLMSLFFKSHMAMERRHLSTGDGLVISGVHGVLQMLLRILRSETPDALVIATDTAGPTFRHELYPPYKAHRPPMPPEMAAQLPILYELIEAAGLPVIRHERYEADDLLASLALRARESGWECFIVTADKDLMQLVRPGLFLYNSKKGGEIDLVGVDRVREKFGVPPGQVVDVLALMGDSSDNVPGVPGVGPKTAAELISRFGDLDGVYAGLEELGTKAVRRKLEEHREQAYLSRQLVELALDAPLPTEPDSLRLPDWDTPALRKRLLDLGLRSILRQLGETADPPDQAGDAATARRYHGIRDWEGLQGLLAALDEASLGAGQACAFDLETTGLDPLNCRIVGFSFSWEEGEAWYLPARLPAGREDAPPAGDLFATAGDDDLEALLPKLKPWFENPAARKLGQNAKYDINVLSQYGVQVQGLVFDTMLASFVLRPSGQRHDLDTLALHYLGLRKIPTNELIGSGARQISMAEVPFETICEYACEDADAVRRLWPRLARELKETGLDQLYTSIDLRMLPVLCRMEQAGVRIDAAQLQDLSRELQGRLNELEAEIHELAGEAFNINSPKQLSRILFDKLRLKPGRRTSTGFSTDERELERLAAEDPLPRRLLEVRQLAKIKGTYADALPRLVNPRTGRVHTSFNQTIAATGRLSSTDPNLQNIPVRSEIGRRIRAAFVPQDENHLLIDADYSQIELRMLAHVSRDEALVEAFRQGADIHARTAAAIFGLDERDVDAEMRRQAKVVNFGVIYGMGAFALAGNLGLPVAEARRFIDEYFRLYAGVKLWTEETIAFAREQGWVANLFGRRRYLPDINSENRQLRESTERIAVNTPIQGGAADLIKLAMIRLDELASEQPGLKMILQVHDELLFEAPRDRVEHWLPMIRREMEQAVPLAVPLVAEPAVGESWLVAK